MSTTVYLNIGSNTGDRHAFISRAVDALRNTQLFREAACRLSEIVESEPWGYDSGQAYLNIGVAFTFENRGEWTADALEGLLDTVQAAERSVSKMPHRNADGTYRDREVDIDIVAVDEIEYESARLVLPHRQMHKRAFVLKPMAELAPKWRHPRLKLIANKLLNNLKTEN